MHQMILQAKTLKITAVITDFDQHLDVDTIGAKTVGVTITDPTGGKLMVANNAANAEKIKARKAAYYAANAENKKRTTHDDGGSAAVFE